MYFVQERVCGSGSLSHFLPLSFSLPFKDTIPTSSAKEDHVSMGGWAARKAISVVDNVEVCGGVRVCEVYEFVSERWKE